jgi:DNA-binding response OmpR family regulator
MTARVLIVDDEEAVISMLRVAFESDGYSVVTAASAADGVRLLASESFDAVITDMKMESDSAGYGVVRAARARPHRPAILILSAYPLVSHEWRTAGADAVSSKPSNIQQLLDTVNELLRKRRRRTSRTL